MSRPGIRQTRRWRNLALTMKAEAGGRCSSCDKDVGIERLELDHVTSLVRGACPYANICETCEDFVPAPESVPVIRFQLADIRELQGDAGRRGWTSEVERHGRVIENLEGHPRQLEKDPASEGVLDTPPMAG